MTINEIIQNEGLNQKITVNGWVKNKRGSKNITFVSLNDGSTVKNLQVIVEIKNFSDKTIRELTTGCCLSISGNLVKSQGSGQNIELIAKKVMILGSSDAETYPLQPKKHSLEFLREKAHLRFRTNTFSSVFRIRHSLTYAIHKFFHERGFFNIHTPIITAADAEGAGETFQVTTLNLSRLNKTDNTLNYSKDFFGKKTNLTVSGQLEAELAALGLGKVYTFGPTFRAENSNTSRHLSEFWMIEPEVAFADLNQNIDLAEKLLKCCIKFCLKNNKDDLEFLHSRMLEEEKNLKKELRSEINLIDRLKFVVENDFEKITYQEAINILISSKPNKKKKFDNLITGFGNDLQSEHEKFLVEKVYKKPVVITNYPKKIKAFYMKLNEDKETVKAMDILFPSIGEIVGGSQREDNLDMLKKRMNEMEVCEEDLWWYLETRKFGSCVHSGFGLGFERLVMYVTGMKNIRDVIPFPRTPQNASF